ncbi:MAG: alpha/beta hydrolase, partial [Acidobacteriota bacterium]
EDGISAKLDSPNQKITGAPVTTIQRDGTKLKFEMKQFAGTFEGTIEKDLKTIKGDWSQGGGTLPLILKKK